MPPKLAVRCCDGPQASAKLGEGRIFRLIDHHADKFLNKMSGKKSEMGRAEKLTAESGQAEISAFQFFSFQFL
jgi:hypothetical protein